MSIKRLRAYASKLDAREIVIRFDCSDRAKARETISTICDQVPLSYSIEREHIFKQRGPFGRTKGAVVNCMVVVLNTDTRQPLDADEWQHRLEKALACPA